MKVVATLALLAVMALVGCGCTEFATSGDSYPQGGSNKTAARDLTSSRVRDRLAANNNKIKAKVGGKMSVQSGTGGISALRDMARPPGMSVDARPGK